MRVVCDYHLVSDFLSILSEMQLSEGSNAEMVVDDSDVEPEEDELSTHQLPHPNLASKLN
jgi:hypothetical protein